MKFEGITKERNAVAEKVLEKMTPDIKVARLLFMDINGMVKSFEINANRVEHALFEGESFDGSSITGYGRLEESDMVAIPDPTTFTIIPWVDNNRVCSFICDVYNPNGTRYEGDPRYILQRAVKRASDMGYVFNAAPELEFFFLKNDGKGPEAHDMRGYFDFDPGDEGEKMRRQIVVWAQNIGIQVDTAHHEGAKGQHEVDFRYDQPIPTSDHAMMLKMLIRVVASKFGYIGTFMPKPFFGHNGSGMHIHQSLWANGENKFYDADAPGNVSSIMKKFIAGQLKYAKEMCAVLCSWPNSYKRLVPGYEAPIYIAWDYKNRSTLIRIPNFFGSANSTRFEIRCPDGAGNIYLQLATLLQAGLEGIASLKDSDLPPPANMNVFELSEEEKKEKGIENLPGYLSEALEHFERSEFMKRVLGKSAFMSFLDAKKKESDLYRQQVSPWELDRYINRL